MQVKLAFYCVAYINNTRRIEKMTKWPLLRTFYIGVLLNIHRSEKS